MDPSTTPSRRQFLAMTGVGAGMSVAGCNGLIDDGPAQTGDGETGGGDGSTRRATLVVQPDQQAMQAAERNATQQIDSGDGNQTAAVQQFQETQRELVGEAVEDIETAIDDGSVTIEDREEQVGALLVSGPAGAMIDLLSNESVGALVAEATFEQLGQQQTSINQTQGG